MPTKRAMLLSIRIKNLALVEELSLDFGDGFTAITGETGAGKSILIGALGLVLGERADRDWIRSGADSCAVEAVFDLSHLSSIPSLLESLGLEPCQDAQLILKRIFNTSGNNRQFINGSPTTLQILGQIGEFLVDIHGPHEHQSLLKIESQLHILDRFAGLEKQCHEFAECFNQLREIETKKRALIMDEKDFQRQLDLLSHQVNEIEAARIIADEEEKIEADYRLNSNAQKLLDLVGRSQEFLSDGENNASQAIAQAERALRDLMAIDPEAASLEEANQELANQLNELARNLSQYASRINIDPDRLQFLSERMTILQGLKRKYGKTLEEVIAFGKTAKERLQQLQGREKELSQLEEKMVAMTQRMEKFGKALRASRHKIIPQLSKIVSQHLQELGFAQSSFTIKLLPQEVSVTGMDGVEFLFSPNSGESSKPLREIASSGEIARVMLALKTALADQDEVPLLIFDEVDANVGGEIGNRVGEKMAAIGKHHQVLCITHLPQVAVHSKHHLVVRKTVDKGRTLTQIESPDKEKSLQEIARMLGGVNDTAIKHAREMLRLTKK